MLFCSCVFRSLEHCDYLAWGKRKLILVFCSICTCLVLSVSTSSWCLRRAAVCDCGTPWTFLLPFLYIINLGQNSIFVIWLYLEAIGLFGAK